MTESLFWLNIGNGVESVNILLANIGEDKGKIKIFMFNGKSLDFVNNLTIFRYDVFKILKTWKLNW